MRSRSFMRYAVSCGLVVCLGVAPSSAASAATDVDVKQARAILASLYETGDVSDVDGAWLMEHQDAVAAASSFELELSEPQAVEEQVTDGIEEKETVAETAEDQAVPDDETQLGTAVESNETGGEGAATELCYKARRYAKVKDTGVELARIHLDINWCAKGSKITRRSYLDGYTTHQKAGVTIVGPPRHSLKKPSNAHWVQLQAWTVKICVTTFGCLVEHNPSLKLDFMADGGRTLTYRI